MKTVSSIVTVNLRSTVIASALRGIEYIFAKGCMSRLICISVANMKQNFIKSQLHFHLSTWLSVHGGKQNTLKAEYTVTSLDGDLTS